MLTGQSSHPCSTIKRISISIIMAMFGTLDVLLQFRNFRNIDLYHQGVYYLRAQVSVPEERQRRRKRHRRRSRFAGWRGAGRMRPAASSQPARRQRRCWSL